MQRQVVVLPTSRRSGGCAGEQAAAPRQLVVSPAPFRAWRAQSCGAGEAQNVVFWCISWGELPSLRAGVLEDGGLLLAQAVFCQDLCSEQGHCHGLV